MEAAAYSLENGATRPQAASPHFELRPLSIADLEEVKVVCGQLFPIRCVCV